MPNLIRNKRRPKLVTPSNSSFSNCVQDHLFIQPLRGPLESFKPVVYLDEQGRKHGRTNDHLLQRQIENDRQKIPKTRRTQNVPRDAHNDDDEEEDEGRIQADDEVKFIEYKKSSTKAATKSNDRRISTVSGKQSVKFDTTPSVNMARLVDSHLTELDDIDNVDEDESESEDDDDDDDDLESIKPASNPGQIDKSAYDFSETPSTPKNNEDGIPTNSSLEYSEQIQEPPSVEDIDDAEVQNQQEQDEHLSSDIAQRHRQSTASSEERRKSSASSRPKTAPSSRSHTDNEETKSSRASSSTASDDTSALLRSDNDPSSNSSDDELDQPEERVAIETPMKSDHSNFDDADAMNMFDQTNRSPLPLDKAQQRDAKGEYNTSQVIQLKESFQPIINEAASYGHLDIVRKLIERGQSVHTQNILQRTPLHEACVGGNGQLVAELVDQGALIDQRDSQGMTPLHVAAKHGTLKCIRILCEKGCDINAQDNLGQTAAHYSALHDHVDVLKYLIQVHHTDLAISNNESKFPIHYAAKYGSKNIMNFFLQAKLSLYAMDKHGNTIAHEASEYNQIDCLRLMWKMNRTVFQYQNRHGRTPIHTAALFGSTKVLHWFLELNMIDIDQPDNDGYTMAHLAASRGHGECFSCLITHGAQLDVYTFDRHESVMDIGKRSGKNGRIEQARELVLCGKETFANEHILGSGAIRCHACEDKLAKEKYDKAHARNAVEQLIHTQIQRGYHLNIPVNRSLTNLSNQRNRPTT